MSNLLCKKPSNNGKKVLDFIGISKYKKRKIINPSKLRQRILDRRETVVTCNDITQLQLPNARDLKKIENIHSYKSFYIFKNSHCAKKRKYAL